MAKTLKKNSSSKIVCNNPDCHAKGKPQSEREFYSDNNDFGKKFPVCKTCLQKKINNKDIETVFSVLRSLNVVFDQQLWTNTLIRYWDNPLGNYMRQINGLSQYKGIAFHSKQTEGVTIDYNYIEEQRKKYQETKEFEKNKKTNSIDVDINYDGDDEDNEEDDENRIASGTVIEGKKKDDYNYKTLIEFWGSGYDNEQLVAMQKKYDFIKINYPGNTSMHVEGLRRYVSAQCKYEYYQTKGDNAGAKQWFDIAEKAAASAKINVAQINGADARSGYNNFGAWARAVENVADVGGMIKLLNTFKHQPIDSVDFEIWCYINFIRSLSGKSEVSYEEVYKFYDKMKEEYIEDTGDPYNIFADDPTNKMRTKIEKYIEPLKEN